MQRDASPEPTPPVRIGRARFRDLDAVCDLLSLVSPGEAVPRTVPVALSLPPGRLTHGDCLCLTARLGDRIVGVLMASPPRWTETHPLRIELVRSVLYIGGVAVAPDCRGRGIASELLRAAEQHSRAAGLRLITLEHPPGLTGFYTRHGYTAGQERLLVALPDGVQVRKMPGHQSAVKPLALRVGLTEVPGAPARVVTGLLPGCAVPPSARYRDGRLVV
ncbi:GNAT family N-acetyltransferase [Streptomyces misionensis]|uniref:GNAT family N-acetyltransferase n=1 Tax=Streptomyces misionensis TaxID=67331 RepID=UPI0033D9BCEC